MYFGILGLGCWKIGNVYHGTFFTAIRNNDGDAYRTKLNVTYANSQNNNSGNLIAKSSKQVKGYSYIGSDFMYMVSKFIESDQILKKLTDFFRSNPSTPAFSFTNNEMVVSFPCFYDDGKEENSNTLAWKQLRAKSRILTVKINLNNFTIQEDWKWQSLNAWSYNGYVDNSYIEKHGIKNESSPYIYVGEFDGYPFIAVINNLENYDKKDYSIIDGDSNQRYYLFENFDNNLSDSYVGLYLYQSVQGIPPKNETNYLWTRITQNKAGIPILEYLGNNDSLNYNEVYSKRLFFGASENNRSIMMNLQNRETHPKNTATYDYHTKITNNTFNIGDSQKFIVDVNYDYLMEFFNFETDSNNVANTFQIKNAISSSQYTINPNTIVYNLENETVTFELYVTALFNELGEFQYFDLDSIKQNWQNDNKIGSITITGYKSINQITFEAKQPNASTILPSEVNDSNIGDYVNGIPSSNENIGIEIIKINPNDNSGILTIQIRYTNLQDNNTITKTYRINGFKANNNSSDKKSMDLLSVVYY